MEQKDFIQPDWLGAPKGVGALSSQRTGGFSIAPCDDGTGTGLHGFNLGANVEDDPACLARNRQQMRSFLPREPVWLQQVHGTVVVDAAKIDAAGIDAANLLPVADASFTDQPGIVCAVTTADCLPVLLTDHKGSVVAAAHAGWRGLAAGVLQNTVVAMRGRGAGDLMAWLGPAIGPEHFEVGEDVRTALVAHDPHADAAFREVPGKPGKYLADLYHLARLVLAECGVSRIAGGSYCTYADAHRFYSYRRDGKTGRMATMIWIK